MKSRRILAFVLALSMIFSLVMPGGIAFADAPEEYAWNEVTDPTCTEDGCITYYNENGEEVEFILKSY